MSVRNLIDWLFNQKSVQSITIKNNVPHTFGSLKDAEKSADVDDSNISVASSTYYPETKLLITPIRGRFTLYSTNNAFSMEVTGVYMGYNGISHDTEHSFCRRHIFYDSKQNDVVFQHHIGYYDNSISSCYNYYHSEDISDVLRSPFTNMTRKEANTLKKIFSLD